MSPRWTLLLGFSGPVEPEPGMPAGPVLASLARHRPGGAAAGRAAFAEGWVVHATRDWSLAHLELAPEDAARQLLEAVAELTAVEPGFAVAHRWRYALTERPLGASHVWLAGSNIGLCGDWCLGDRAEHAYASGVALAARLRQSLRA